ATTCSSPTAVLLIFQTTTLSKRSRTPSRASRSTAPGRRVSRERGLLCTNSS
ncbi:unnamed protein product, partial [Ectocarpus sp. 13 AM-2016]